MARKSKFGPPDPKLFSLGEAQSIAIDVIGSDKRARLLQHRLNQARNSNQPHGDLALWVRSRQEDCRSRTEESDQTAPWKETRVPRDENTPIRASIYARYSSDLQRAASIDDQVRLCRERIERE